MRHETTFLDFEQPIAELEAARSTSCASCRTTPRSTSPRRSTRLQKKSQALTKDIYAKLTPWQVVAGRAPPAAPVHARLRRARIFTDFEELHGDRAFADDPSIVGGLARFNGAAACMVIGHQKGRDTKEKIAAQLRHAAPEGYRKALRLMKLAEKFGCRCFTFVDTPGAYPGIGAEERGQSEAIGRNLYEMAELRVPIISTIIGEGGSGGALAIAVGDAMLMLQYSTYSVISPEGCASILWKSADEGAARRPRRLGITANRLKTLGLIDKIVTEPLGGAHRDPRPRRRA